MNLTCAGDAAVTVVALEAFRFVRHESIDDHVSGADVKGDELFGLGGSGDYSDVRDASDVEGDAADPAVAEEQKVDVGDKRGSFTAGGNVALAEVGDGRDTGAFGDYCGFSDLKSARYAKPKIFYWLSFVENGLPVEAAEFDGCQGDALAAAGFLDGIGVKGA